MAAEPVLVTGMLR